ncbi:MAG: ABC transporter permease [Xanthobacteraceae bacterium]|nr:ABC transporter permease [Xanthobacteraceae bacterium]
MTVIDADFSEALVADEKELSVARRIWLETRKSPWFTVGLGLFVVLVLGAFLYPLLSGADPQVMHFREKLLPPAFAGGSWAYPLGTDQLGRDMLSRSLVGLQISFLLALAAVVLTFAVGAAIGLYSGFHGGLTDQLLMRVVDVQLSIPPIILAITILGVTRPTPALVVLVLTLAGWPTYARVTRAAALGEREREYVRAARVLGASDLRILGLLIAPVVLPPLAFAAVLDLARLMIFEATLDFLGLGLQPPTPTLGTIIADGRKYLMNAWWVASLPGVFLIVVLLAVNMMGVALERARNRVLGGL